MNALEQTYINIKQKIFDPKKLIELYDELDSKIADSMLNDGYSVDVIKQAIRTENPTLKNRPLAEVNVYIDNHIKSDNTDLVKTNIQHPTKSAKEAYKEKKQIYYYRFDQLFAKYDLDIACILAEKGHPLKDIVSTMCHCSLFSTHIKDQKNITKYVDKVLANINNARFFRNGKVYDLAKKAYIKRANDIIDKYSAYSKPNFNSFHEGVVVISMMMNDHFFPEIIEQVLRRNSLFAKADDMYVKNIMDRCRAVKKAYEDIDSVQSPKNVKNEHDAYCFFAGEYMRHTGTKILNGRDEQRIIARMFAEKLPEDTIKKALEASPVSMEPGRDKNKYIDTVITLVKDKYASQKQYAEKQLPVTKTLYIDKINRIDAALKAKGYIGVEKNRTYYDGIAAKGLLNEHQSMTNIIKIITQNSPQAFKITDNPNKTPESYAKWIVNAAKKAIEKEKEILNFEEIKIPKDASYKQLKNMGITPQLLYLQAIKERINIYPSLSDTLTSSFIDRDALEKIIVQHPDADKEALYQVICKNSPRNCMPGISEAYPGRVMNLVNERIEKLYQQKETAENTQKNIQKEYVKQCGLATEGVNVDRSMMLAQDGRAALRMLMNNIDPADIKNAIATAVKTVVTVAGASAILGNMGPLVYANEIVKKAQAVQNKINIIADYVPTENKTEKTVNEDYIEKLQILYRQKHFMQSSMDADVMKQMILENKYPVNDIENAIRNNSPIAIEPGRDDKYEDYVEAKAKENIEREKQKLNYYKPVPRLEHSDSAIDEYKIQQKQLMNHIDLPYTDCMDILIVETLLAQEFAAKDIISALDDSPLNKSDKYAENILKQAEQRLTKEKSQNRDNVYVRTLTTITTTTTKTEL